MSRYRVVVTFSWEVESDQAQDKIMEEALKLLPLHKKEEFANCRLLSRLDKLKDKPKKLRLGELKPEDVIPFITKEETKRDYVIEGVTYAVRMNSHRYFIFRESLECAACGLVGCKMLLEQHPADKSPHFNLYGEEDGKLVLMTKDHIQAKAFGGEDRHSNYQTMCVICNNLKGSANITLDGIRELRKVYNENFHKLPKKQLYLMIQEVKSRLALPRSPEEKKIGPRQRHVVAADKKSKEKVVIASGDIGIWQIDADLLGKSVYEKVESGEQIACIKKGTPLEPIGSDGRKVIVRLNEGQDCIISQGLLDYKENVCESESAACHSGGTETCNGNPQDGEAG